MSLLLNATLTELSERLGVTVESVSVSMTDPDSCVDVLRADVECRHCQIRSLESSLAVMRAELSSHHALLPSLPAPPSPPSRSCGACDNRRTDYMISNGKECASWGMLQVRCTTSGAYFYNNRFCRQSCYDAGWGYPGDTCCPAPIAIDAVSASEQVGLSNRSGVSVLLLTILVAGGFAICMYVVVRVARCRKYMSRKRFMADRIWHAVFDADYFIDDAPAKHAASVESASADFSATPAALEVYDIEVETEEEVQLVQCRARFEIQAGCDHHGLLVRVHLDAKLTGIDAHTDMR
jgi:hypothetical protein